MEVLNGAVQQAVDEWGGMKCERCVGFGTIACECVFDSTPHNLDKCTTCNGTGIHPLAFKLIGALTYPLCECWCHRPDNGVLHLDHWDHCAEGCPGGRTVRDWEEVGEGALVGRLDHIFWVEWEASGRDEVWADRARVIGAQSPWQECNLNALNVAVEIVRKVVGEPSKR